MKFLFTLCAFVMLSLAPDAFAQDTPQRSLEDMPCPWQVSAGEACPSGPIELDNPADQNMQAEEIPRSIYCDVVRIISGDLGTLIGLVVALVGLWFFISGKAVTGFIGVLIGSSVTAAPAFYVAFLDGLAVAFNNTTGASVGRGGTENSFESDGRSGRVRDLTTTSMGSSTCRPGDPDSE